MNYLSRMECAPLSKYMKSVSTRQTFLSLGQLIMAFEWRGYLGLCSFSRGSNGLTLTQTLNELDCKLLLFFIFIIDFLFVAPRDDDLLVYLDSCAAWCCTKALSLR